MSFSNTILHSFKIRIFRQVKILRRMLRLKRGTNLRLLLLTLIHPAPVGAPAPLEDKIGFKPAFLRSATSRVWAVLDISVCQAR
jgi:hypothetical protein